MTKIISYRDLKVWQKAMELAVKVYMVTKAFPKEEIYGLTSQIRRAAFAIAANIAEGYARGHLAEYQQFLRIAFSSGAELETHLLIARRVHLLREEDYRNLSDMLSEVMRMLNGLMEKLRRSKASH